MLEMQNISKRFGAQEALGGVSLSIKEGEVVAVIGPSGSGKSTLLRIAALLERADRGSVSYVGMPAASDNGERAVYAGNAELRACLMTFGMVFQSFELFPHMSVLSNITDAPIHVKKRPRKEAEAAALSLLEQVGLSDKAESFPCQLSGGERQRVCIARALAMEPSMLFFDEPTSALDPGNTRSILETMRNLASLGMTMLVVTHEMRFAREVADRVIFLEGGRMIAEGPASMLDSPSDERLVSFLSGSGAPSPCA